MKKPDIQSLEVSLDTIIGDYTFVGKNTAITKSIIGRYCSIATNCSIGMGEHLIDEISTSVYFYKTDARNILVQKDLVIKNDVWIGVDSIIKRNVTIGNGAIIGANSFVNKDVEDFAIYAGNPAKLIRYRFSEKNKRNDYKINAILNSNWWNYDIDVAKQIIGELEKI